MKEKQYQYLEGRIRNISKTQERKIQDNINKSKLADPSEILRSSNIDSIERECMKFLQSVCQGSEVYDDVRSRIEQMIRSQSDSVLEKMEKIADEKGKKNFAKQVRDLKDEIKKFIDSEVNSLESNLKDKTYAELSATDAQKLRNSIITNCRASIKNFCEQQKISQSVWEEAERKILRIASKRMNEIHETLNNIKKEKSDTLQSNIEKKISDTLSARASELEEDILQINSTDYKEMIRTAKNKIDSMRSECIELIEDDVKLNKASLSVRNKIVEHLNDRISQMQNSILGVINNALKRNKEAQRNTMKQKVDDFMERKKIELQRETDQSILPSNLFDEIRAMCKEEIGFNEITDEGMKLEIEDYIFRLVNFLIKQIADTYAAK